uniref:C2 domain-containing protein n=1 Tax=Ascaris lumbricoides TaxID=6252 RepID=A0A0M3I6G7_ASCLU
MMTCRAQQLAFLPGPSSSLRSVLCRSLASQTNNASERPQMFQLDHIRARLEFTVSLPLVYQSTDKNTEKNCYICYQDQKRTRQIRNRRFTPSWNFHLGLQQYMAHLGAISVTCQFLFPHIEMEIQLEPKKSSCSPVLTSSFPPLFPSPPHLEIVPCLCPFRRYLLFAQERTPLNQLSVVVTLPQYPVETILCTLYFQRSAAVYGPSRRDQRDVPIPFPSYRNGGPSCVLCVFRGLQQYMAHLGAISVTCQFLFPHIEMEIKGACYGSDRRGDLIAGTKYSTDSGGWYSAFEVACEARITPEGADQSDALQI